MKARQPLLRLYLENRRYIPGLALILLISLLAGGLKLAVSTLWGQAVDFGVAGRVSPMLWAAGAMALVILVDCARTAVHYHIIGRVTETMFRDVRRKAFRKLTTGDAATLERDFRTGDTATRLNSDIDVLNNFTAGHVSNFSRLLFQGVVALAGCLFLSWQMSLAYLVVLPLSLWIVKRVSAPIQAKTKSSLDSTGAAMSVAAEAIQGALTVKAFGAEEELARRFDAAVASATQQKVQSEKISQKLTGVKYAANVLQTMALFLLGSVLVTRGAVSVGTLVAFLTLSNYITEPFGQLDYMISQVRRATATAQRYFEVMDVPDEVDGPVTRPASPVPCQARNLAFSYDGQNRVLQHVPGAQARGHILADARLQRLRRGQQGHRPHLHALQGQAGKKLLDDFPLVHHPAENHRFIGRTPKELPQQKGDVLLDHGLRPRRHLEGFHVPAPVPVQKNAGGGEAFQLLADGGFAHAHGPANQIQTFHGRHLSPCAPAGGCRRRSQTGRPCG